MILLLFLKNLWVPEISPQKGFLFLIQISWIRPFLAKWVAPSWGLREPPLYLRPGHLPLSSRQGDFLPPRWPILCCAQPGIWGSFLSPSFPSRHLQLVTMKTPRIHLLSISQITQFSPSSPLLHHSAELLIPTQGSCLLSPFPISIHCPQNDPDEQTSLLTPLLQTYNIGAFKSRIKSPCFTGEHIKPFGLLPTCLSKSCPSPLTLS